jgi:hypothetical protein
MLSVVDDLFTWTTANAAGLGVIVAALAALILLVQYVGVKKSEDRKHTFEAYHKLIGDLVDPPTPRLDRQIAAVYELRNFKEYFPVSLGILEGVKAAWTRNPTSDLTRIVHEIDLAINFMKKKQRIWNKD